MSEQTEARLWAPEAISANFNQQPMSSVLQMEQRGLNAWPAPQTLLMGTWAVRAAGGYTKRANSANAMQAGAVLDEGVLEEVERVYAGLGQPCIFRISPLADAAVDRLLQAKGYLLKDPSLMMIRTMARSMPEISADAAVAMQTRFSDAWFDGVCNVSGLQPAQRAWHRRILQNIGLRCGYGSISKQGRTVAWGLVVLERSAAGIYDVVVDPAVRGQGWGRKLMQGLLHWATEQGAGCCDLQVTGNNQVAQSLYRSLGFSPAYAYHYRIAS